MSGNSFPSMRMHRLWARLQSDGFDRSQIDLIRQAILDTLDNDTHRIGDVCDIDGCDALLTFEDPETCSYPVCPEHGQRGGCLGGGPFAVAVAFPPLTRSER